MEDIKEYDMAYGGQINHLIQSVNARIKDGWQPFGDVFTVNLENAEGVKSTMLYQPMVKRHG